MTDSPFFKDWWAQARANNGLVTILHSWWDADGSKPESKRIKPGKLSDEKLFDLVAPDVIMEMPTHFYATYTKPTLKKLATKLEMALVAKHFEHDGALVVAHMQVNLYKALCIEDAAMAEAADMLFTRWAKHCKDHPGSARDLVLRRDGKELVVKGIPYRKCNEGERLAAEADLTVVMQEVKEHPGFEAWITSVAKQGGRYNKTFRISQDQWFGPMNPAMDRVAQELAKEPDEPPEDQSKIVPLRILDI